MTAETEHSHDAAEAAVELAARAADGLYIALLWRPRDNVLEVVVEDERERLSFTLAASTGAEALELFHHPFAYAAARGITDARAGRRWVPSVVDASSTR